MKYEIDFSAKKASDVISYLFDAFNRSEEYYEKKDIMRNIVNCISFSEKVNSLRMIGAKTEVGTYGDGDYLRIGFAKINEHIFVNNGNLDIIEMCKAIDEIAE